MKTITITKAVLKTKGITGITCETVYTIDGKRYFASITNLTSLKKMLKNKGYTDIKINDTGITKCNY
jgi:hypothetical protein